MLCYSNCFDQTHTFIIILFFTGHPDGAPRRPPPPQLQAEYGYEPYAGQAEAFDPYRGMQQPRAGGFPPGPMPRGPRPQASCHRTLIACSVY